MKQRDIGMTRKMELKYPILTPLRKLVSVEVWFFKLRTVYMCGTRNLGLALRFDHDLLASSVLFPIKEGVLCIYDTQTAC